MVVCIKKILCFVTLTICLFFLISCNSNAGKDKLIVYQNKKAAVKESVELRLLSEYKLHLTDSIVLKHINAVCSDVDGNLYMSDLGTMNILKFDNKGGYLCRFGGKGNGPGEIAYLFNLFTAGDTLFAVQPQKKQLDKFSTSGDYYGRSVYDNDVQMPQTIIKSDSFFINRYTLSEGEKNPDEYYIQAINIFNNNLIYSHESNISYKIPTYIDQPNHPYNEDDEIFAFTTINDIIYVAENSDNAYRINGYNNQGKKKLIINKAYQKIPVSIAEAKRLKKEAQLYGIPFHSRFKKSIYELQKDKYNRLWVKTPNDDGIGYRYEVYEDGTLTTVCSLQHEEDCLFLRGDRIVMFNKANLLLKIYDY